MAHLIYGITNDPAVSAGPITGVKGLPVVFTAGHGLCAARSEMPVREDAPPVADLLAYGDVVEKLYHLQPFIPMRYGSFLNAIPEIQDLLGRRNRQYKALLAELAGHVEMGIRLLLPGEETPPRPGGEPKNGTDFLVSRRARYRMREGLSRGRQGLEERTLQVFEGLYARHRTETTVKNGSVVFSLYFLTPEDAVKRFHDAFRRTVAKGGAKALLSGPWPPYNFVMPDLTPLKETGIL